MGKRYFSPGNAVDLSIYIMSIVIVSNVSIGMPSWSLCQTEEVYYHVYYIVQLGQGQLFVLRAVDSKKFLKLNASLIPGTYFRLG